MRCRRLGGADIGLTGISFAFGLALIAMACGIGPVSGCHINPAVTLGVVASGRMSIAQAVPYMIAQVAGDIVGAVVLLVTASDAAINQLWLLIVAPIIGAVAAGVLFRSGLLDKTDG